MKKYIYFRESLIQSILADTYSFLVLGSLVYVNYSFLGQKWYFDALAIVCFLAKNASFGVRKEFTSLNKMKKYVNSLEK